MELSREAPHNGAPKSLFKELFFLSLVFLNCVFHGRGLFCLFQHFVCILCVFLCVSKIIDYLETKMDKPRGDGFDPQGIEGLYFILGFHRRYGRAVWKPDISEITVPF